MFERKGKIRSPPKPHINSYQHSSRITELLESFMQDNKLKLGVTRNWVYRIHMYLVFTGLISGFLIYKIGDVDSSKIWPLALGVSLSMLLPLIFGSIRNKSFKKGYLELVESNFHYGYRL